MGKPPARARVLLRDDTLFIGKHLQVSLQRTLRVPDHGPELTHALPVSLGRLPLAWARDYADAPAAWHGAVFVPLHRREALWLGFSAPDWHPCALRVGVGGIDAVTGDSDAEGLTDAPQNYLVSPPQPWLDGVNAGPGHVRQFVAVPLGSGLTVEGQLTGGERFGAIRLVLHEARPGRFADEAPPEADRPAPLSLPQEAAALGMAPGGRIRQRIYRDPYGLATWSSRPNASVTIHLLDSRDYERVTGRPAPSAPIDERTYRERGLPWFELDDEALPAVPPAASLRNLTGLPEEGVPTDGVQAPDQSS